MNTKAINTGVHTMNTNTTEHRELRRRLNGALGYRTGCGNEGKATWLNISRTGASVRLGRYLRPGRRIYLETEHNSPAIPADIVWCVPVPGTLQFRAGLQLFRSDPEIALLITHLGQRALGENKNSSKTVVDAVWPSFHDVTRPLPNADVTSLTHAV